MDFTFKSDNKKLIKKISIYLLKAEINNKNLRTHIDFVINKWNILPTPNHSMTTNKTKQNKIQIKTILY